MISVRAAESAADYQAFGELIAAYVGWCRVRYAESAPWLVDMAFGYQALDDELQQLDVKYGPPKGKTLLAFDGDTPIGGIAYRKLSDDICEMKRLYVRDSAAGKGAGRKLSQALIDTAKADGFTLMRLDTSRDMVEAIGLYETLGFSPCAPYIEYPDRLKPMIVFMERPL